METKLTIKKNGKRVGMSSITLFNWEMVKKYTIEKQIEYYY